MSVKKINDVTDHKKMREFLVNLMNQSFGQADMAIGSATTKFKTASAITFRIDGIPYEYAATDDIVITACEVQALATFAKYLLSIESDGSVTTTKGDDAATAALALLPDLPAGSAPIGYFQINTDGTSTFTAGTTDLTADATDTYGDISCVVTES
jgi:hypothetical protein